MDMIKPKMILFNCRLLLLDSKFSPKNFGNVNEATNKKLKQICLRKKKIAVTQSRSMVSENVHH